MYKNISEKNIDSIRKDIQDKLDELKSVGLHIKLEHITYAPHTNSFESSLFATAGESKSINEVEFLQWYEYYGVHKDCLNKTFKSLIDEEFQTAKIIGMTTNSNKYIMLLHLTRDDRRIKVTMDGFKEMIRMRANSENDELSKLDYIVK